MADDLDREIGNNVRAEMARRGLYQRQLAAALGTVQESVSDRLQGKTPWRVRELQIIGALLGVSVTVLLPDGFLDPPARTGRAA